MSKPAEFRDMNVSDLENKIKEMEGSLFDLRLQSSMAKLQNHSQIRHTRRDIARGLTVLREKQKSAASNDTVKVEK